jgi:hypothetical protein
LAGQAAAADGLLDQVPLVVVVAPVGQQVRHKDLTLLPLTSHAQCRR